MPHGMLNYYTFLLGLEFLSATTTVSATCFLPNGTDRSLGYRPADQYIPINTGDNVTMCCAATDGPRSDDTNPSPTQGRQEDNDEIVTQCGDLSYCCGPSGAGTLGSTCCNEGRGVFIRDGTTQQANPSATSSSPTSSISSLAVSTTPSANAGSSTSATSTSTPPQKSTLNTGAIAGGVVGGLAGLALILAAIWFLLYRKKKTNKTTRYEMAQPEAHPTFAGEAQIPQEVPGSLTEDYGRQELQAGVVSKAAGRPELDTV